MTDEEKGAAVVAYLGRDELQGLRDYVQRLVEAQIALTNAILENSDVEIEIISTQTHD